MFSFVKIYERFEIENQKSFLAFIYIVLIGKAFFSIFFDVILFLILERNKRKCIENERSVRWGYITITCGEFQPKYLILPL